MPIIAWMPDALALAWNVFPLHFMIYWKLIDAIMSALKHYRALQKYSGAFSDCHLYLRNYTSKSGVKYSKCVMYFHFSTPSKMTSRILLTIATLKNAANSKPFQNWIFFFQKEVVKWKKQNPPHNPRRAFTILVDLLFFHSYGIKVT